MNTALIDMLILSDYKYAASLLSIFKVFVAYVNSFYNKGLALYYLGNYTGAVKYYDKVLDIDPKNVIALKGNYFIECCIKVPRTIKVIGPYVNAQNIMVRRLLYYHNQKHLS